MKPPDLKSLLYLYFTSSDVFDIKILTILEKGWKGASSYDVKYITEQIFYDLQEQE